MTDNSQIGFDFDLSHEESVILSLIRVGRANARQVPEIAKASGINERQVQLIVKRLIQERDYCIGTGTKEPFGYYRITEPAEIEAVYRSLRRRGISTLYRAARLRKISVVEVFGQGELEGVK